MSNFAYLGQKKALVIFAFVFLIGFVPAIAFADNVVLSPVQQMEDGVAAEDVVCKSELALMISPSGDAACVKEDSVKKLENINWKLQKEANKSSPESDVVAAEDFVSVMEVKISGGDFSEDIIIDTFSLYNHGKDRTTLIELKKLGFKSYFLLESLPSKDKTEFYNLISQYVNPRKRPEAFDVTLSGILPDGSTLLSLKYLKCQATEYTILTQSLTIFHQFSGEKKPEIRDHTLFYCQGNQISEIFEPNPKYEKINEKYSAGSVPVYPVADENDRVQSFTVHFFDGELEELYTFNTFKEFSPSVSSKSNPYVTSTSVGNPFGGKAQFYLESLPSKDKKEYYEFISRYVNPTKPVERFKVSIDAITGDGTILQRWNYVDCHVFDYKMHLEEFTFRYPFSGEERPEILEKTDFECLGRSFKVFGHDKINEFPIYTDKAIRNAEDYSLKNSDLTQEDRAMSFRYHIFGGQLTETLTLTSYPKFESLSFKRGPNVPIHHPNQYDHGFYVESSPSKEKVDDYQFLARYINPGQKAPEPYSVTVDVLTGDDTILHQLKYTKCSAIDYDWYIQDFVTFYTVADSPTPELRERYTHYCKGFLIATP